MSHLNVSQCQGGIELEALIDDLQDFLIDCTWSVLWQAMDSDGPTSTPLFNIINFLL